MQISIAETVVILLAAVCTMLLFTGSFHHTNWTSGPLWKACWKSVS